MIIINMMLNVTLMYLQLPVACQSTPDAPATHPLSVNAHAYSVTCAATAMHAVTSDCSTAVQPLQYGTSALLPIHDLRLQQRQRLQYILLVYYHSRALSVALYTQIHQRKRPRMFVQHAINNTLTLQLPSNANAPEHYRQHVATAVSQLVPDISIGN
jgi:hypothetical protein